MYKDQSPGVGTIYYSYYNYFLQKNVLKIEFGLDFCSQDSSGLKHHKSTF